MTVTRSAALQGFLDALRAAFAASPDAVPECGAFVAELFVALDTPAAAGAGVAARLPVCRHLPSAYRIARSASPVLARLTDTLEQIAPLLAWKVRSSTGPNASANWPEGHANAVIIGRGGLEERDDVAVGASLLAPHVRYPDHDHPPEELYLVLTPGLFQHGVSPWREPGPGGTFHNPPGIRHAMRSGSRPLLALWTMIDRPAP